MSAEQTTTKEFIPYRLRAVNKIGAGWEIEAEFTDGESTALLKSDAIIKMVGYAPWLDPFTHESVKEMIGKLFGEMTEAWNEKQEVKS